MTYQTEEEIAQAIGWEIRRNKLGWTEVRGILQISAVEAIETMLLYRPAISPVELCKESITRSILNHFWTAERQVELERLREIEVEAYRCPNPQHHRSTGS